VVHDRKLFGRMRMRVVLGWSPVRRPACMPDARHALEGLALEARFEILELALGTAPLKVAVLHGGHAGGVVTPIFQPLQRVDQMTGNGLATENSDYSAHYDVPNPHPYPGRL